MTGWAGVAVPRGSPPSRDPRAAIRSPVLSSALGLYRMRGVMGYGGGQDLPGTMEVSAIPRETGWVG